MELQSEIEKVSGQITVNSTARIMKKMRRNLAKNAVNRFNRSGARRASELLASINDNGHEVTLQSSDHSVAEQASLATRPAVQAVKRPDSRRRNWTVGIWRRCVARIFALRKR